MAEAARFKDALRTRDARLLTGAYAVDAIGGWAYFVVLLVVVHDRTGSSLFVALATLSGWLPRLLTGPYGGVLADRYDRVRVMVASALTAGALMSALTVSVVVEAPVWVLLLLNAAVALSLAPYFPAAGALRAAVVAEKDLVAINALFAGLENLVVVLGPLLGGLLLLLGEPRLAFALNAATFFVAAVLAGMMKVRSKGGAADESEPFLQQLGAGAAAVWRAPIARALTLLMILDSAVYGASTVLYVALGERLGEGADALTYLTAAFAAGGVAISVVVNRLAASPQLAPVVILGLMLMAVPFAASGWIRNLWVVLALQMLVGVGMVMVDVLALTALQRDVPGDVLGRVLGVVDSLVLGGILLASLAVVPLLEAGGVPLAAGSMGAAVLLGTALGIRPLLRADRENADRVELLRPRVRLLEDLDLLSAAPQALLERLAGAIEVVVAEPGTTLMRQGEEADALWIVAKGGVRVSQTDALGREHLSVSLGPHSYVGEIGLLNGVPRTATVRVTAPSLLWRIPAEEFRSAMSEVGTSPSLRSVAFSRLRQLNLARAHPVQVEPPTSEADERSYTL